MCSNSSTGGKEKDLFQVMIPKTFTDQMKGRPQAGAASAMLLRLNKQTCMVRETKEPHLEAGRAC